MSMVAVPVGVPTPTWLPAAVVLEPALQRARAIARRLLGCEHLAADAVQEALIVLCRQPAPPPELHGWLVRAVAHRARHLRRTARRRRHYEHAAGEHCELHRGCDNPLHQAYAHELGERLDLALAALPEPQRAALALQVDIGLDYRGIAERLALPIGTVRSRLHRARAALQAALGAEAPAAPASEVDLSEAPRPA
jgi:RNA polymerase sigma-70 factor, ECF subfamily